MLADLGAEVIRVESTQHFPHMTRGQLPRPTKEQAARLAPLAGGYPGRDPGQRPWNRHPWFNATARNKLSMTVDLEREPGPGLVRRLAAMSDLVISNQRPGKLRRLGVGYDDLASTNPRLCYVEASAFGSTGPYAHYVAMGNQMEAFAGHDHLRHARGQSVTTNTRIVAADATGAVAIAIAGLMALHERERTGRGHYIDLSMVENFIGQLGSFVLDWSVRGRLQESLGNRDYSALQGCYQCRGEDRWIVITVWTDEQWTGLCQAFGHPDAANDQRFVDAPSRHRHHDAADELIRKWAIERDRDEIVHALRRNGICSGPVLDDADALNDQQLKARGYFVEENQEDTGSFLYPGFPYRFLNAPLTVRRGPVRLGEDNEYVYKQLLGLSDDEYSALERDGHIGTELAAHLR
jgi:crotonobetainyl-CoA:carnitine CoA-transferase CaiB-like acyl-CoA transferase